MDGAKPIDQIACIDEEATLLSIRDCEFDVGALLDIIIGMQQRSLAIVVLISTIGNVGMVQEALFRRLENVLQTLWSSSPSCSHE